MSEYLGLPVDTGYANRPYKKRSLVAVPEVLADVSDSVVITQTSSDGTYYWFDVQVKDVSGASRAAVFMIGGWQSTSNTVPSFIDYIHAVVTGYVASGSGFLNIATNASGLANIEMARRASGVTSYMWIFFEGKGYVSGAIAGT